MGKKEKKEKDEKKEKKEKKEKDDDKEKKEKKPTKLVAQTSGGGFNAWDSVGDSNTSFVQAPQDKRTKEEERERDIKKNAGQSVVKTNDVIAEDMKKKNDAK